MPIDPASESPSDQAGTPKKPRKPRARKAEPDAADTPIDPKMSAVYATIEKMVESVLDRRAREDFRRHQDDELDARYNGNVLPGGPQGVVAGGRLDGRPVSISGMSLIRLDEDDELLARLRSITGVLRGPKVASPVVHDDDDFDEEAMERDIEDQRTHDMMSFALEFLPHVANVVGPFVKQVEDKDGSEDWRMLSSHESIEGELGEFLRAMLKAGTAVANGVVEGVVKGVK